MVIYRITNKLNGRAYIGQTIQIPIQRWRYHCCNTETYIGRAIQKYGRENFKFEVICCTKTLDDLNYLEELLINQENTIRPNGYNIAFGGGNLRRSAATRKKIGRRAKEVWIRPGYRERMSKMHTGKKLGPASLERKLKISRANKGKRRSLETRKKISEIQTIKRPFMCLETGQVFQTAREASQELGVAYCNIRRVLRGLRKTAGGMRFKYINPGLRQATAA